MAASVAPIDTSMQKPNSPQSPQQQETNGTPPISTSSSPSSLCGRRARTPLSIDLNNVPPLTAPAPPSNTLLITRLDDPHIFHPASLATIRQHINELAPLHSFAPLKSLNRIICSFYDTDSAIRIRQEFDGAAILGHTVAKCYFGEPTPLGDEKKYLEKPDAGRLFFISPPPSPPVGWEMRPEDPPNKDVHADDLAAKLAKLTGKMQSATADLDDEDTSPTTQQYTAEDLRKLKTGSGKLTSIDEGQKQQSQSQSNQSPINKSSPRVRSRSSTLIYDPVAHGDSPALPAVMLETEDEPDEDEDGDVNMEMSSPTKEGKRIMTHTARPPLELMNDD